METVYRVILAIFSFLGAVTSCVVGTSGFAGMLTGVGFLFLAVVCTGLFGYAVITLTNEKPKTPLTTKELIEPNGTTIILGTTKDDIETLSNGDVVVYSDKLTIEGKPLTIKLNPNSKFALNNTEEIKKAKT